jgi:hypothetical protein
MISGVAARQIPTSCPGICARWYFNRLIPPHHFLPTQLAIQLLSIMPISGITIFPHRVQSFRHFQIAMIKPREKKMKIKIQEKYKNVAKKKNLV